MEQRRQEDAPAAPSTTSTAVALCDFFLLSPGTKPGSQPVLLVLLAWRPGAPFIYVVPFKVFIRSQMCHPGSFPDYINVPAVVSPRMLTLLSLSALIFALGRTPLQGLQGQGGLPCARRGVRVCVCGSCLQDLFV